MPTLYLTLDRTPRQAGRRLHFLPASAPDPATAIRQGVVDLAGADIVAARAEPDNSPPPWTVCTFGVDGAVGKLRDAANSTADERPATLPHLRSAGLQLVRPGRAADYAAGADATARGGR